MFDLEMLILSFAGGMFGAAIGGLPSFVLCGVAAVVGLAVYWATGEGTFVDLVAWGPLLGPHIAFAGGVGAAAYAAKKGKIGSGKDIVGSLMGLDSPDVLLVGGVFGALGYAVATAFGMLGTIGGFPWTNLPSISIITTAIVARLAFGSTGVFGKVRDGANRWLASPEDGACWLPWQTKPAQIILISVAWGLPIAFLVRTMPELFTFGFGMAAIALVFLGTGSKFPVFHHMGIMAGMGTLVTGNIWWGIAFGLLAGFLGEVFAVLFLYHGDTHVDPPAFAVFVTWTIVAFFATTPLAKLTGVVPVAVAAVVAVVGYFLLTALQGKKA